MELQPLTNNTYKSENTKSKSILRRMPRVWSDEIASGTDHSDEDLKLSSPSSSLLNKAKSEKQSCNDCKKCLLPQPSTSSEITGKRLTSQDIANSGVPLLQKLKMLKQKNDQEAKMQNKQPISSELTPNQRAIGAGFPLLQKIQNFRQKNNQKLVTQNKLMNIGLVNTPIVQPENATIVPEISPNLKSNTKIKTPKKENTKVLHQKSQLSEIHNRSKKSRVSTKLWTVLKNATVLTQKTKLQDLKTESEIKCDSSNLGPNIKPATEFSNISNSDGCENKFILMCQTLDDQYKQGSLIAQNISAYNILKNKCTENNSIKDQCDIRIGQRPNVLHLENSKKKYNSINDLSPKYAGLSFVKKLKILNELQKRAEHENNDFLKSSSLDLTGCKNSDKIFSNQINRSHSETVALEVILRNQKLHKRKATSTNDCNETAERIRLKNILKKLSSNSFGNDKVNHLMSSQTIEGYAARHSKLTRNVTFNQRRTIIESSPVDACGSMFAFSDDAITMQTSQNPNLIPFDLTYKNDLKESSENTSNTNSTKQISPIKIILDRSNVQRNYSDEILNNIKTIVEKYLVSIISYNV